MAILAQVVSQADVYLFVSGIYHLLLLPVALCLYSAMSVLPRSASEVVFRSAMRLGATWKHMCRDLRRLGVANEKRHLLEPFAELLAVFAADAQPAEYLSTAVAVEHARDDVQDMFALLAMLAGRGGHVQETVEVPQEVFVDQIVQVPARVPFHAASNFENVEPQFVAEPQSVTAPALATSDIEAPMEEPAANFVANVVATAAIESQLVCGAVRHHCDVDIKRVKYSDNIYVGCKVIDDYERADEWMSANLCGRYERYYYNGKGRRKPSGLPASAYRGRRNATSEHRPGGFDRQRHPDFLA